MRTARIPSNKWLELRECEMAKLKKERTNTSAIKIIKRRVVDDE